MPTPIQLQASILESADRVFREWRLPGLAVWAGWKGHTLLAEGFGCSDLENTAPVSADTLFPIASVTKPLTVHALEILVRNASMAWKDPIRDHLSTFRLATEDQGASLTLEQALSHRQPLPPHTWAWVFGDTDRGAFIDERLPHLAALPLDPSEHRYSNMMYAVAGRALELRSGQTWEQFLRDRVLNAYGLMRTQFLKDNWTQQALEVALPYRSGLAGPQRIKPFYSKQEHLIAPASELLSSVNDLGAWLQARLDQPPDPECLLPLTLINQQRPHPCLGALHAGLGWRLETFRGQPHYWHSGQCSGNCAWISLCPGQRFALAVLANLDGAVDGLQRLAFEALDLLEEARDINWAEYLFPAPKTTRPPAPTQEAISENLPSGRYIHPGYGSFDLEADGRGILQEKGAGRFLKQSGEMVWHLEGYDKSFPAHLTKETLELALEPAVEPIRFERMG